MRAGEGKIVSLRLLRASVSLLCVAAVAAALLLLGEPPAAPASLVGAGTHAARAHAICSGQNSAAVPCRFATPSGNIRCVWTPRPNNVACVLRSSGRAYRLRPAGRARAIRLRLTRRGQTLPTNQQIVFPESLSCRDTKRTMICNQDFGTGAFTLAPRGSHRS